MNIFILDSDHQKSAEYHVDKHIVKMPLETAQLLCTALRMNGCEEARYKATHKNHPCAIWARQTRSNFVWLCLHGLKLCKEYSFRYGKTHKCEEVINHCLSLREKIPSGELTKFALAMPEEYKNECPISSYRLYYKKDKTHLANWTKREIPKWFLS